VFLYRFELLGRKLEIFDLIQNNVGVVAQRRQRVSETGDVGVVEEDRNEYEGSWFCETER
jgi:hypothetical protein